MSSDNNTIYDVIIVGGGPAGITAGIYSARKKLNCLMLTKDFLGQIAKTAEIDNWPGTPGIVGVELMRQLESHLKSFVQGSAPCKPYRGLPPATSAGGRPLYKTLGFVIEEGVEVEKILKKGQVFFVKTSDGEFQAKAVIVAVGSLPRKLGIAGEAEFAGRGVSFCPTCDAPFFKDKAVAVVGSGNSGLEAAIDLAKYACAVFILEKSDKSRGDELLQEKALQTGKVRFLLGVAIKEIRGNKWVQEIVIGRDGGGKEEKIEVGGVFVLAGFEPASSLVNGLVDLNEKNEIKVNAVSLESSVIGLFAAGDVNDLPYKQFVVAAGQGAVAALSAYRFLTKPTKLTAK